MGKAVIGLLSNCLLTKNAPPWFFRIQAGVAFPWACKNTVPDEVRAVVRRMTCLLKKT
jgi:hypothetical protein